MYVLAIDTSTKVAGAAMVRDGALVSERFIHNKLTHSQILVSMVEQVIRDAGITIRELNGVAVTAGPGSFTGLRIGMTFAKTLAQVLTIPVTAISTLEVLAANVRHFNGLICPIMDARKKEVYSCTYWGENGLIKSLTGAKALSVEDLVKELQDREERILFLGDGVPAYFDQLKELLGSRALRAEEVNLYPRAGAAALLGEARLINGKAEDLYELAPVYIRRSEAEITWEKKRGDQVDEKDCSNDLCTP